MRLQGFCPSDAFLCQNRRERNRALSRRTPSAPDDAQTWVLFRQESSPEFFASVGYATLAPPLGSQQSFDDLEFDDLERGSDLAELFIKRPTDTLSISGLLSSPTRTLGGQAGYARLVPQEQTEPLRPALHRPRSTVATTSPTRRDWVGWIDTSGSESGGAENGPPDHHRMEHEAEREITDDADDHGGDVVLQSALGNRRPPRIAAVFEGDAIIDGPGQHRSEQDDPASVAIDAPPRFSRRPA